MIKHIKTTNYKPILLLYLENYINNENKAL